MGIRLWVVGVSQRLWQAGGGGGGASRQDEGAAGVIELDGGFVGEGVGVAVEGDGVGEPLGALRESVAAELDVGDVAGGVGVTIGLRPGSESGAALAGEEAGVGGGFSQRAAAGEQQYGGERRALDAGCTVVLGDGDPPGASRLWREADSADCAWTGISAASETATMVSLARRARKRPLKGSNMGDLLLGKVVCDCMVKVARMRARRLEDRLRIHAGNLEEAFG